MKVNPSGIDAYRHLDRIVSNTDSAGDKAIGKPSIRKKADRVTLLGTAESATPALRVAAGPSVIAGILSPDEKSALIKHFARFGDTPGSGIVYDPRAKSQQPILVGQRLDLKG